MLRIWQIFVVFIFIQQLQTEVAVSLPRLHPGKFTKIDPTHQHYAPYSHKFPCNHSFLAHPGQCYDFVENVAYNIGAHYPPGKCTRLICRTDYSLEWQTWVMMHVHSRLCLIELMTPYKVACEMIDFLLPVFLRCSCGSIELPAGHCLVENLDQEYPRCCPMPSSAVEVTQ